MINKVIIFFHFFLFSNQNKKQIHDNQNYIDYKIKQENFLILPNGYHRYYVNYVKNSKEFEIDFYRGSINYYYHEE